MISLLSLVYGKCANAKVLIVFISICRHFSPIWLLFVCFTLVRGYLYILCVRNADVQCFH